MRKAAFERPSIYRETILATLGPVVSISSDRTQMNAVLRMIQPDVAGPTLATIGAALRALTLLKPQVFARMSGSTPGSMTAAHWQRRVRCS